MKSFLQFWQVLVSFFIAVSYSKILRRTSSGTSRTDAETGLGVGFTGIECCSMVGGLTGGSGSGFSSGFGIGGGGGGGGGIGIGFGVGVVGRTGSGAKETFSEIKFFNLPMSSELAARSFTGGLIFLPACAGRFLSTSRETGVGTGGVTRFLFSNSLKPGLSPGVRGGLGLFFEEKF